MIDRGKRIEDKRKRRAARVVARSPEQEYARQDYLGKKLVKGEARLREFMRRAQAIRFE